MRMNEYEAQQGSSAGRLQSDLNAVRSAVEESLSETYRMKVEPGQREDAERQRRAANDAVLAGIAAFEADLKAIAASEVQQDQETNAAGLPAGAVDQREGELLAQLHEAFPEFKANAEKFTALSDTASSAEGEFVQRVFEPEVNQRLNNAVQELATSTDEQAQENRRNIGLALRSSYRWTIVVVLFGLTLSFALAVLVSRSVIGPIREMSEAAYQLGQGKMETRIRIHTKDELGQLATSFNRMVDDLSKLMREGGQTQEELSRANEKLTQSMGELESRNREAAILNEMADLLQSCFSSAEASQVIAASARKLFPECSGGLLVFSASRNVLEATTTWGSSFAAGQVFGPNDCWALRRGRMHHSIGGEASVRCAHFVEDSRRPSLCTPLIAHGDTLGILCLVADAGEATSISDVTAQLAASVAEQAGLAFANLKLREKLRFQSVRDPLTGLHNRRYLDESLEREVPNAIRKKRSLGIIMLDVDHFKRFNDTFGHDAGDTVLKELGDYLAKFIRRGDLACRYGGEEFTLVLPEASLEDTRRRAEELRSSFPHLSITHKDTVLGKVTLSLGVAALPDHGATAESVLTAADRALMQAKTEGRDRVVVAEHAAGQSV